jgi:hypothetical protein
MGLVRDVDVERVVVLPEVDGEEEDLVERWDAIV